MSPQTSSSTSERVATAASIMDDFAARTGLTSELPQTRYLWTDAHAVENHLALARATGDRRHLDRALALVDRVHDVLGHHRGDDGRRGPLGTREHPTSGGLRIGKKLPERRVDEPFDPELEWDRDGQYFHYATRWMRALADAAHAARRPELLGWARDLAQSQHRAFAHGAPSSRAMFWKMSIDLSRPLVRSMGQHDALDGYVTYALLEEQAPGASSLASAISDFVSMIRPSTLATADPLGLIGLAIGLHAAARIISRASLAAPLAALDQHRWIVDSLEAYWLAPAQRRAIAESEHRDIDEVMLATSLLSHAA